MNIVCLSTLGVSTGYIVDRLLHAFPEMKLIRLHCEPRSRSKWSKLRGIVRGRGWRRLEDRLFYSRYQARGFDQVQRVLYGNQPIPQRPFVAELPTTAVNHISTASLLRSLQPDLMITIGAPLLKPHIYSIPQVGTINIHFGIAPYYRGEETLFWPLYYRDEQQIGVTIHQIDSGIDTGPMLAQGFAAVDAEDTEWTLDAKSAQLGARPARRTCAQANCNQVGSSLMPRWDANSTTSRDTCGTMLGFTRDATGSTSRCIPASST